VEQHEKYGIPEHLIGLIRDLYTEQEAKVQVKPGTTVWFPVQKGVRQGCILSPGLFILYSVYIIRTAGLEDIEAGVKIGGRKINNVRYADDTILLAENKDDMVQMIKRVKISSEKASLKLNIKKNQSNEHWGTSKHISRRRRNKDSNKLQVLRGSHHQ
jgi:hypothetical protein